MNWHELSVKQKEISQEIAKSITVKPGSTMESIRKTLIAGFTTLKRMLGELDRRIADNNDKLSKHRADEANAVIEREKKQYIADIKTVLKRLTGVKFEAKRQAVTDHIRQMPSDALNQKIQFINTFGSMFDKETWEIFLTDPEIISNPLACKVVGKMANEHGIEFVSAPDLHRTLERIDDYETMINNAIEHIEDEHNLVVMSVLSGYPDSPVKKLESEIDSDLNTVIHDPKDTVLQRLKDAEKTAEEAKDYKLYAKIKVFRESNEKALATPEEIKDELFSQAESLIMQGMSAEKGNK